jgi:hypothetical protein
MSVFRKLFIFLYIIMGNASGKPETLFDTGNVTAKRHFKHRHQQSHKHRNKHWHGFRTRHRRGRGGGGSKGITKKVYRPSPLNPHRSRTLADATVEVENGKVKVVEPPLRESLLISQQNKKVRTLNAKRETSEKRKAMELQAKMEALANEQEAEAAAEKKVKEAESERKRKSAMKKAKAELAAMEKPDPEDY